MFTGLSAFPLTPISDGGSQPGIDERAFAGLIRRLSMAGVDSIGALGSTGSYAYLTREQRARAVRIAVDAAGTRPVMVGIGAVGTSQVLALAEDAQAAGAAAVLLAPVSYQALTEEEVFGLYSDVTRELSVPLCVYDNPATTRFTFTDELHARIAQLPNVGSIKIPGVPGDAARVKGRIDGLRAVLPPTVTIGVSGDWLAAAGLNAGCDAWYSAFGGLFPETALAITRAAAAGRADWATALSELREPLWVLFRRYGSLRVLSAAAEQLGLARSPNLPRPVLGLDDSARHDLASALASLGLAG